MAVKSSFMRFLESGQLVTTEGHIRLFGVEMVLFTAMSLAGMHYYANKEHPDTGTKAFCEAGRNHSRVLLKHFAGRYKLETMDRQTFMSLFAPSANIGGFGVFELVEFKPKIPIIVTRFREND